MSPSSHHPDSHLIPEKALLSLSRKSEASQPWISALSPSDLLSILDAFPFNVMLIDAQHRIVYANTALTTALGLDPKEVLGKFCPSVIHGTASPYDGCPLEKARRLNRAVEVEVHDPENRKILRSCIIPTEFETSPGCTLFLHTVRDITKHRKAQQAVERAHHTQRFVNEVLRLSLQDLSLDDILDRVTHEICSLSWLSKRPQAAVFLVDEASSTLLLKKEHGHAGHHRACQSVIFGQCVCGRTAAKRIPQFSKHTTGDHTNSEVCAEEHGHYCLPILHGETLLGVLSISLDSDHVRCEEELDFLSAVADTLASVIQRKRAEEMQRHHQSVAVAHERMARVGELSAGVAHTIRNPLHGLLSCVDLLQDSAQRHEPAPTDVLALMRDGLERLERVTRRLLSLTRGGSTERIVTNVGNLLDDVVDFTTIQASQYGIGLQLEASFRGDALLSPDRVVEGLTAVIGNALEACQAGHTVTVRSLVRDSSALVLEVQDDGEGISEEDLPHVMDPFFTTKPIGAGSGLGLAITKHVMFDHDGETELTSSKGVGTTVRLVFPGAIVDGLPC